MADNENRTPLAADGGATSRKRSRFSYVITGNRNESTHNNPSMASNNRQAIVALPPPMDEQSLRRELGRIEAENQQKLLLEQQQQQQHHHHNHQQQQQGQPQRQQQLQPPPIQKQENNTTATITTKSLTKKGVPRKKPIAKRTLPPHLIVLYQELKDNACNLAQNEQETKDAQRLLAEAQRRLDECARQAAVIEFQKRSLDQEVLEAELQLDNEFTRNYRQLVHFQQEFGHCHVTTTASTSSSEAQSHEKTHKYQALAAWTKKMRRVKQMRANPKGEYYQGTQWKYYIQALDRIGFVWDAVKDQWRNQFEKMLAFQVTHGHCAVPKGMSELFVCY